MNLVELRRVLRKKFKVPAHEIDSLEKDLRFHTIVPKPRKRPAAPRVADPDDQLVLEAAIAGGAELLVTGDGDLHAVAKEAPLSILAPREAWLLLRTGGAA